MAKDDDGVWLDGLLNERLKGTEKQWRDLNRLLDELGLYYRLARFPLISDQLQYHLLIYKMKKDKAYKVYEDKGMEIEVILKKAIKYMNKYRDDHKDYLVRKPGGGEMI